MSPCHHDLNFASLRWIDLHAPEEPEVEEAEEPKDAGSWSRDVKQQNLDKQPFCWQAVTGKYWESHSFQGLKRFRCLLCLRVILLQPCLARSFPRKSDRRCCNDEQSNCSQGVRHRLLTSYCNNANSRTPALYFNTWQTWLTEISAPGCLHADLEPWPWCFRWDRALPCLLHCCDGNSVSVVSVP